MRAAQVDSSLIHEHKWTSLQAGDHIGHVERSEDEVRAAKQNFKNAQARLQRAENKLTQEQERAQQLLESGKLIPIELPVEASQ